MLHVPPKDMSFKAVRARLRNPPNAVPDLGIDLRRKDEPEAVAPYTPLPAFTEIIPLPVEMTATPSDERKIKVREIQDAVCEHFDIALIDLLSHRKTVVLSLPRQIAMYLAKTLTPRSLPEIGRYFDGRDHTTVLHAVRKIDRKLQTDVELTENIQAIKTKILAPKVTVNQLRCVIRTYQRPQQCNWHVNITTSTPQ